jgi:NAD(P)H-dependent flavin oxidoreductase YrpB (nitropropane dioxygenase family)
MLTTRVTRRLGISHPVIQAGMGGVARAALVAAVSNAGGLGMLGMIRQPAVFVREQIRLTRTLTSRPFGVNLVLAVPAPEGLDAQLAVCLEERVPVVSFFWGDAGPFVERCHAAGTTVMLQLGSTEEARRAADAGVDLVVAQGVEAGGHVRGTVGLLPLIASIVEAVPGTSVIASGGIVDGRGLAAVLAAGADGAWIGTRFVATDESEAHSDYKKRLVLAGEADTVHTEAFHIGWPPHSPHRVLRNALTDGLEPSPGAIGRLRRGDHTVEVVPFSVTVPTVDVEGQTELMANYAGQGVGLVREILPAAAVVERIVREAETIIGGRLAGMIV